MRLMVAAGGVVPLAGFVTLPAPNSMPLAAARNSPGRSMFVRLAGPETGGGAAGVAAGTSRGAATKVECGGCAPAGFGHSGVGSAFGVGMFEPGV